MEDQIIIEDEPNDYPQDKDLLYLDVPQYDPAADN